MRRLFDLTLCLIFIVPISAFIAFLALVIMFVDGFAPFHLQKRVGRRGVFFTCFKLQTMRPAANPSLIGMRERDHERVTTLGTFLRDHGWDELPQVWNVLCGDMSFMGPRPLLLMTLVRIRQKNAGNSEKVEEWEKVRSTLRPGISGWHQVRYEEDFSILESDLRYLAARSWREDIKIVLATIAVFVVGKRAWLARSRRRLHLEAHPRHILDVVLWPILRVLWEPFSRKQSHFWHWKPFEGSIPEPFQEYVDPDKGARPVDGWWTEFWNTNFGWKKVVIFRPANPAKKYHLGFMRREGNGVARKEICTCVLDGACAAAVSPYNTKYFAVEYPHGPAIPLDLVRVTVRHMLEEDVPLL